jgi:hypothetical protein
VELTDADHFTEVLQSSRGRGVRVDLRVTERVPGRLVRWEQELERTPFERHLAEAVTEVRLAPTADGTLVTIEQRQRLRGASRAGAWMLRRATAQRLDRALTELGTLIP